jgi:hypothetical protein
MGKRREIDGPEDRKMMGLVKSGKIEKTTKPSDVKMMDLIFEPYTNAVIGNHLKQMKKFFGVDCKFDLLNNC